MWNNAWVNADQLIYTKISFIISTINPLHVRSSLDQDNRTAVNMFLYCMILIILILFRCFLTRLAFKTRKYPQTCSQIRTWWLWIGLYWVVTECLRTWYQNYGLTISRFSKCLYVFTKLPLLNSMQCSNARNTHMRRETALNCWDRKWNGASTVLNLSKAAVQNLE